MERKNGPFIYLPSTLIIILIFPKFSERHHLFFNLTGLPSIHPSLFTPASIYLSTRRLYTYVYRHDNPNIIESRNTPERRGEKLKEIGGEEGRATYIGRPREEKNE